MNERRGRETREGTKSREDVEWKGNGWVIKFCGSVFGTTQAIYLYPGRVWLDPALARVRKVWMCGWEKVWV